MSVYIDTDRVLYRYLRSAGDQSEKAEFMVIVGPVKIIATLGQRQNLAGGIGSPFG